MLSMLVTSIGAVVARHWSGSFKGTACAFKALAANGEATPLVVAKADPSATRLFYI